VCCTVLQCTAMCCSVLRTESRGHVCHDSFSLIYMIRMATCLGDVTKVGRDSFIHMCAMTHLHSFIWFVWILVLGTWPRCDVTHVYMRHDSCTCVKRLICILCMDTRLGDVTKMWCDSFIRTCAMSYLHSFIWFVWPLVVGTWPGCDVTDSYVCHDSFICVTWLKISTSQSHYPLNLSISIIPIPRTLSSTPHNPYHANPTNTILWFSTSPSSKSQHPNPLNLKISKSHDRCHPNSTNSIFYISQSLPCQSHQHYPLNLKISIL